MRPETELLPLGLGFVLTQLAPGPNMLTVSASALGGGRAVGVATAAGVATGVGAWASAMSLGMGALLAATPVVVLGLELLAGVYLVGLGLLALGGAARAVTLEASLAGSSASVPAAYRRGVLFVLANPRTALVWLALSAYLSAAGAPRADYVLLCGAATLRAILIYGGYALVFSTGTAAKLYGRFARRIAALLGVAFILLGGWLVAHALLG